MPLPRKQSGSIVVSRKIGIGLFPSQSAHEHTFLTALMGYEEGKQGLVLQWLPILPWLICKSWGLEFFGVHCISSSPGAQGWLLYVSRGSKAKSTPCSGKTILDSINSAMFVSVKDMHVSLDQSTDVMSLVLRSFGSCVIFPQNGCCMQVSGNQLLTGPGKGPFSSYRVAGNGVLPSLEEGPRRSNWDAGHTFSWLTRGTPMFFRCVKRINMCWYVAIRWEHWDKLQA